MRAARGSGMAGLSGIRSRRDLTGAEGRTLALIRPLLAWRREDLRAVAEAAGPFVDDPTNTDPVHDRTPLPANARRSARLSTPADWPPPPPTPPRRNRRSTTITSNPLEATAPRSPTTRSRSCWETSIANSAAASPAARSGTSSRVRSMTPASSRCSTLRSWQKRNPGRSDDVRDRRCGDLPTGPAAPDLTARTRPIADRQSVPLPLTQRSLSLSPMNDNEKQPGGPGNATAVPG